MRYREGLELVLRGVNIKLDGGMKCGVVGRTGSGKSSLMLALFRIVEASGGGIKIDGEDINGVGLDLLRCAPCERSERKEKPPPLPSPSPSSCR